MTVQTLVYIITTLFTYGAGLLSKKMGWNYNLPITIQNIIIIAIASYLLYIQSTTMRLLLDRTNK